VVDIKKRGSHLASKKAQHNIYDGNIVWRKQYNNYMQLKKGGFGLIQRRNNGTAPHLVYHCWVLGEWETYEEGVEEARPRGQGHRQGFPDPCQMEAPVGHPCCVIQSVSQ
jgi:hypothetical protein